MRPRRTLPPGTSSRRAGLACLGLGLLAYFSLSFENFFSTDNALATALNVSSILIAAVGSMALLTAGAVDLSIGSQLALVSVVCATVVRDTGSPVLGAATALILGLCLGCANGLLVRWLRISPLIVTIGTLAIYRGLAFLVADGVSVFGLPSSFTAIGRTTVVGVPAPVIVAGLIFLVGACLLQLTVGGLHLYAIGGNEQSARLAGIPVGRSITTVYALNGLCVGVAALLVTARLGSGPPSIGSHFELDVLTAVILGGVAFTGGSGHPVGVLVGVATIGILNAGLIFAGLDDWYQQIAKGSLLLLALGSDKLVLRWRLRRDARTDRPPTAQPGLRADVDLRDRARPAHRSDGAAVLKLRGLSVRYGSALAIDAVDLELRAGEVVCLVGDNGAGKSTLVKAVSGAVRLAAGTMLLEGRHVELRHPAGARRAGIETVHQDLALCDNLGAAHNLVLGDEPRRGRPRVLGLRDDGAAVARTRAQLGLLGVSIGDMNRPVGTLSGGERQCVAVGRVLRDGVRVVVLDEPTATLGVAQTVLVLRLVRDVAAAGRGVILVSHDIEEIFGVADRVVVLRLGRIVHDGPVADLDRIALLQLMAGFAPRDIA